MSRRETVGELIRTRRIVGGEMVDDDLILGVGRYEAEMLRRRPDLAGPGWRRVESRLPLDLLIWVPSGIVAPAGIVAPGAIRRPPP